MRINGFIDIPSSNVKQGTQHMHMNETEPPKSAKVDQIRDTVEISSQKQTEPIVMQEQTQFSLLPWLEQHWNQVKEKTISFWLKKGILKIVLEYHIDRRV